MTQVELAVGDGARGFGTGEYDAIVLTGSTPVLPDAFVRQLRTRWTHLRGGRRCAGDGGAPHSMVRAGRRTEPGSLRDRDRSAQERGDAVAVPVLIPRSGRAPSSTAGGATVRAPQPVLIDVREPWEFEYCRIEGSLLIPLGELASRIDEIPADRPLVMVCHHGHRSDYAAALLQQAGFTEVHNLRGGVEAWAAVSRLRR